MTEKMRILVPVDGTRESEAAVPAAAKVAEAFGAELTLVRVVEVIDAFGPHTGADVTRMVEEKRAYLYDLARRWELPLERTQCLVARTQSTAKEIIHIAKAIEAGLVIMAGRGKGRLQRWLQGSVSAEVVGARPCPVLVLPTADGLWYEQLSAARAAAVPTGKTLVHA